MKLSPGAGIALGIGALVVLYFVMKNNSNSTALPGGLPAQPQALPINIAPFPIISNAGVAVDVQPPLNSMQLTFN